MIVIFTGPTLSPERAREVLPDAEYRPPVIRGDLARLPPKTKIVGIIDGVFFSETAIAHKEIIAAMQKGITVLGSSSMGALRAAELADFGMIGVGKVYECYRSGRITDDDEVAVTFNPVTGEQLSEPLVNVRYQLKAAELAGIISREQRSAIIGHASEMFYPRRTYRAIADKAVNDGVLDSACGDALLDYVRENPVNLKADDAILLLEKVKSPGARRQ